MGLSGEGECEEAVQADLLCREASVPFGYIFVISTHLARSVARVTAVLELRVVVFLLFFIIVLPMYNSLNIHCLALPFKKIFMYMQIESGYMCSCMTSVFCLVFFLCIMHYFFKDTCSCSLFLLIPL